MVVFVSETQSAKTPSGMACGQHGFEIMLWKDGIVKHVCVCVCISHATGQHYDFAGLG